MQNIKYDFIKQVEIHNVVDSLESFRGVVIVGCSAKQIKHEDSWAEDNQQNSHNTATSKEILLKFGHKGPFQPYLG